MPLPWQIEAFNPPFGDPGFLLTNLYSGQGLMFDLGDLHQLSNRQILKAGQIFISHGHIDHLIGFDHLLRLNLNRPRHLYFYGPPGIIELLGHKLRGYSWNLTARYELRITVSEISDQELRQQSFACHCKFQPEAETATYRKHHLIHQEPGYSISGVLLDHGGLSCLALLLEEDLKINFYPDQIRRAGWTPGPWLTRVREGILARDPLSSLLQINGRKYSLGEIIEQIATVQPGRRIAYVADIGFSPANRQKLLPLISSADLLICEAAFLDEAADKARASHHLTAAQAGKLATQAQAQKLKLFHFSPRHNHQKEKFYQQARDYFSGPIS
jgi:ribonuclease Z